MKKKNLAALAAPLSLAALLAAALLPSCATSGEKGAGGDYSGFEPGVTVLEDPASPTGYTAVFVYQEDDEYASAEGPLGKIAKVELYSDCMLLFDPSTQARGAALDAARALPPDRYRPGLYPAGGNGENTYYVQMEELGGRLWGASVPLSSGAFVYNFRVTDTEGRSLSRLDDRNNPAMANSATGISSLSSMAYVPYNAAAMGTGEFADRSIELPRADGKRGTVETISYTGAAGDTRGLAVYLPYGYSESAPPYNVLYLSHGMSGDLQGNELRWMSEGAVPNIMDNLAAEGRIEPFVVVAMNNQDLEWDYEGRIWPEQEAIMRVVEARYNVASDAAGRAFAGLSMGGFTATNMLIRHGDAFSHFGIWSYANPAGMGELALTDEELRSKRILLASGAWDALLEPIDELAAILAEKGVDYGEILEVPAAHDWEAWQLIYARAAENFFWKD